MHHVITIETAKCTGCQICEIACSLKHVHECNPERSLIRVIKAEEGGQLEFIPSTCLQCETAMCELVCPTNAINQGPKTSARVISTEKCIGCSACGYACPFGACYLDHTLGRSVVCDQCGGDPTCVKLCPTGALQYVRADKVNISLKRAGAQRLLESPILARFLGRSEEAPPED